MGKRDRSAEEPEIVNRRARHEYHIDDTLEVGVSLTGSEVKSIRAGKVSLAEGYVRAEAPAPGVAGSMTLLGVHIDEYPPAAGMNQHEPTRARRLLAHKREIARWARQSAQKGFTIVPLKMYFKGGRVKTLIGLARGKGSHDKRQDLKAREAERDIRRAMSRRR